jgi:VanZ family protein
MLPQTPKYGLLGFLCVAFWTGLLVCGLWPFSFFPKNKVERLENRNGIHFDWHGQIYTPAETPIASQPVFSESNSFSIELWLKPDKAYSWGTVLSFYDAARSQNMRIDQSLTDLVLRGNFQGQDRRPSFKPVWITRIFESGTARFVTISSGPEGTSVYLEGVRQHLYPYTPGANNFSGRLLLGHSGSGNGAWAGTLLGLAIHNRPLTADEVSQHYAAWNENRIGELGRSPGIVAMYPFDERTGDLVRNHAGSMPDLVIPDKFYVLHRRFLADPSSFQKSDLADAAVNIVGFIPFGILFSLYLSRAAGQPKASAILWTIILGGLTSFLIEFLQAWLPTRDSSYLDLINNILGAALGAWLAFRMIDRLPSNANARP